MVQVEGTLTNSVVMMLPALRSEAAGRYRALIAANPTLRKFEPGWLNRAYF